MITNHYNPRLVGNVLRGNTLWRLNMPLWWGTYRWLSYVRNTSSSTLEEWDGTTGKLLHNPTKIDVRLDLATIREMYWDGSTPAPNKSIPLWKETHGWPMYLPQPWDTNDH